MPDPRALGNRRCDLRDRPVGDAEQDEVGLVFGQFEPALAHDPLGRPAAGGDPGHGRQGHGPTARSVAGVPVLRGYDEPDASDDALIAAAEAVGFPLLVKPAAGGGGKGMRTVRGPEALPDAIAAARREAAASFDDDRLILEHLVVGARHVEIQVLFDGHGTGIHLGERDCSIQRRHQKILEEAPSPAVDAALRERMGEAALTLGRAVGYVSAGTCEFLLDARGRFTFLEMNTRLQVEHPVTEMVTGRDLVADQLRIAAGEPLDIADSAAVVSTGHAVEVRLYAEDAEDGFLPATGRIEALRWPAGEGIRVDAGIELGSEIGGRFDPMLAKIVAWGPDRAAALARLAGALDATVVLGLVTNLRFLRWLVRQPVVLDGQARTDVLTRIWPPDTWSGDDRDPGGRLGGGRRGTHRRHGRRRPVGRRLAPQRRAVRAGRLGRPDPNRGHRECGPGPRLRLRSSRRHRPSRPRRSQRPVPAGARPPTSTRPPARRSAMGRQARPVRPRSSPRCRAPC